MTRRQRTSRERQCLREPSSACTDRRVILLVRLKTRKARNRHAMNYEVVCCCECRMLLSTIDFSARSSRPFFLSHFPFGHSFPNFKCASHQASSLFQPAVSIESSARKSHRSQVEESGLVFQTFKSGARKYVLVIRFHLALRPCRRFGQQAVSHVQSDGCFASHNLAARQKRLQRELNQQAEGGARYWYRAAGAHALG